RLLRVRAEEIVALFDSTFNEVECEFHCGAGMKIHRRHFLHVAAGSISFYSACRRASSQARRTIKLVVPFAAGGGADILARLLGEQIGAERGASVIVENRP